MRKGAVKAGRKLADNFFRKTSRQSPVRNTSHSVAGRDEIAAEIVSGLSEARDKVVTAERSVEDLYQSPENAGD